MLSTDFKRKLSWRRDPNYSKTGSLKKFSRTYKLPPTTEDLSCKFNIPCYEQGDIGSCTAQSWCFISEYQQHFQKVSNPYTPSRLAFYQCELDHDKCFGQDVGSTLTTGQHVVQNVGFGPETLWPYDANNFGTHAPKEFFEAAEKQQGLVFSRINHTLPSLKTALVEGHPVVCGFNVYTAFTSESVAESGIVPNFSPGEISEGGHAVVLVKMDDTTMRARFRNSWGTEWGCKNDAGHRGYFEVSYAYLLSAEFSDFWICERIENPEEATSVNTAPYVPPQPASSNHPIARSTSSRWSEGFFSRSLKSPTTPVTPKEEIVVKAAEPTAEVVEQSSEIVKSASFVEPSTEVVKVAEPAAEVKVAKNSTSFFSSLKKDEVKSILTNKPTPIMPDFNKPMYGHYIPFPDPITGPKWILVYDQESKADSN